MHAFIPLLPRVVRPLARDRSVGEVDPGLAAALLLLALLVLTDARLFFLEDDGNAWGNRRREHVGRETGGR